MSEYVRRIDRLRAMLQERGLDGMLVTHPTNRRYLTGFTADDTPPDESSGHVIVTPDDVVLLTGSVNVTQAQAQAPHIEVVTRQKSWALENVELVKRFNIHRLGYEPNAMLEGVFRGISEQLVEDGFRLEWHDASGIIEQLRSIKSESEVKLLREAFRITCEAFAAVEPTIAVGQTEREIAWRIHTEFVQRGAEGPAFPIIVAAGENAARPHHEPGDRKIQSGESVVIDMGARYEGYCADLTRTVWVGEPEPRLARAYDLVTSAQDAVLERTQIGSTGKELDSYARVVFEEAGEGDAFSHGLGHGIGLRVHEAPSASRRSEDEMKPGMLLTIEPGVYYPEWGGVRIEDVVLFTEDGYEILTESAPKRIIRS